MSFTLRLLDVAREELAEAVEWYEAREAGLGQDFLDKVIDRLESIESDPTRFAPDESFRDRVVRTGMVRRFPYRVIFEVRGEDVAVLAIAHHRRRPGYWHRRQ